MKIYDNLDISSFNNSNSFEQLRFYHLSSALTIFSSNLTNRNTMKYNGQPLFIKSNFNWKALGKPPGGVSITELRPVPLSKGPKRTCIHIVMIGPLPIDELRPGPWSTCKQCPTSELTHWQFARPPQSVIEFWLNSNPSLLWFRCKSGHCTCGTSSIGKNWQFASQASKWSWVFAIHQKQ